MNLARSAILRVVQWMRYALHNSGRLTRCNFHHKSVTSPITAYPASLIPHESSANIVWGARSGCNQTPTRWSTCCINILYVNLNDPTAPLYGPDYWFLDILYLTFFSVTHNTYMACFIYDTILFSKGSSVLVAFLRCSFLSRNNADPVESKKCQY